MATERNIFWEVFNGLEHQGPGGEVFTRRALDMLRGLPPRPKVVDIGCGTGAATLVLATALADADLTAVDTHPQALLDLQTRAATLPPHAPIQTLKASMFELPFEKESFDLVWSEGSIYFMGFKEGVTAWLPFLKRGGSFVASHLSWLSDDIPPVVRAFWGKQTEVLTVAENGAAMERAGLDVLPPFVMPREGWWENYYVPILERLERVRQTSLTAEQASVADRIQYEIDLYREHGGCYSYVFYIGRKR